MIVKMITYDSEYGDAAMFDGFAMSATSYPELLEQILIRFKNLLKSRTLVIDRESGYPNLVETRSGKTAESYLVAYKSTEHAETETSGLLLADGIFYDPDNDEISCGSDAYTAWERLCDEPDEVLASWRLTPIIANQPWQLNGSKGLSGLPLAEFLFGLFISHANSS